jgi:hypothetical protein
MTTHGQQVLNPAHTKHRLALNTQPSIIIIIQAVDWATAPQAHSHYSYHHTAKPTRKLQRLGTLHMWLKHGLNPSCHTKCRVPPNPSCHSKCPVPHKSSHAISLQSAASRMEEP